MTHLVFIDTETTGLDIDRHEIWEIALIVRGHPLPDRNGEYVVQLPHDRSTGDLIGMKIGGYFERSYHWRHPTEQNAIKMGERGGFQGSRSVRDALNEIGWLTHGAHLIGAVPDFDAYRLARLMRKHGELNTWHYHLVDIENLMVGYLRGRQAEFFDHGDIRTQAEPAAVVTLPWKSDELSKLVGVDPPSDEERHTALGDARWAERVYDKVMGF